MKRSPGPSTRRWLEHFNLTHISANSQRGGSGVSTGATSSSTRRLVVATCVETPSDSTSVEVVAPLPTKHARTHACAQVVSSRNDDRLPVSPRGNGEHNPRTPTSPRRKRRRMADEHEQDTPVDEIEIVVDAPHELRVPNARPQSQPSDRPQPRHKHHRAAHRRCISTPRAVLTSISLHMSTPLSIPPRSSTPHQSRP